MADSLGDAVVLGRAVIANLDLVRRWSDDLVQNELNFSTIYADGATGYIAYPTHDEADGLAQMTR